MDVSEMTPEELREYAARKEESRADLYSRYLNVAPQAKPAKPAGAKACKPWEREVEVEGVTYVVDMRRFVSREFFRRSARIQDQKEAGGVSIEDTLDFYEYCFGGDGGVDDQVTGHVVDQLGYEDYTEVMRIEDLVFEAVDAKN